MRDEIQFQIMMPEASSQSLTVDTPAGGIQWVFLYIIFQRGSIVFESSKQSNSIHRDFVCTTLYGTNKSYNLNTATRPNVLYESFFSN